MRSEISKNTYRILAIHTEFAENAFRNVGWKLMFPMQEGRFSDTMENGDETAH